MTNSHHHRPETRSLDIQSETAQLLHVRRFIADAARAFGFMDDDVNNIALAVDEACTNIIKHAYKYNPEKGIKVVVKMRRPEFEILISDKGNHFDPDHVAIPNMKEYLAHYQKGGLGMFLMRKLMDKVEYRIQPERNIVRLIKYLPGE